MDLIESLQKVVPWVSGLPMVPKLLISGIAVALVTLFLLLVWTPPPMRQPDHDARVVEAYGRMQRILAGVAKRSDGRILVSGAPVSRDLEAYYAPYASIAEYLRAHPGNIAGAFEEVWNQGGQSRTYINDTQALESVVAAFFRAYENARQAPAAVVPAEK